MIAIPAIDLLDGKCVRLAQGDYDQQTLYGEDPVKMAQHFAASGITWLHLVDLEGARSGRVVHLDLLEEIVRATGIQVEFGGGIKSTRDAEAVLQAGASRIIVGSLAVKDPELVQHWIKDFGPDRVVLGADLKHNRIAVNGWKQTSEWDVETFLQSYQEAGIQYILCTEVSRDGMLAGPDVDLYRSLRERFPALQLIASGGVSGAEDLEALEQLGCYAAVVGKALYEGRIPLADLKNYSC